MNGNTGLTMPVFGVFENGGDLVETSFLMEGLLAARQYFHGDTPSEQDLYRRISKLWSESSGTGTAARNPETSSIGTGLTNRPGRFSIR